MLVDFLRANADNFAWSPSDMPGIPREVAEHSLDSRAIGEELQKLLAAGFIKEVFYPEWLANPVLVKKKWEMADVRRLH